MHIMLRIGVWFDATHCCYGGPTAVLLGTLIGFFQDAETTKRPIRILLNEPGDVNWIVTRLPEFALRIQELRNTLVGPLCLVHNDAIQNDYTTHPMWHPGIRCLVPSLWFRNLICKGLPFDDPVKAKNRTLHVWASGVNTDFFQPCSEPKTQDYFIYFKSQKYNELSKLHVFLFNNYFKIIGTTLTYYNYDPLMLRESAQKSRFCFFMSGTETQCLGALEIMACNIPLFVIDTVTYTIENLEVDATSVTCWDERCGMKSSLERMHIDFPIFCKNIEKYRPREFVLEKYSYEAAAHTLREMLETNPVETS